MKTILLQIAPILLLIGWPGFLSAQTVTTTAGSATICPGEVIIPVNVTGFTDVGAFTLVLQYNPSILTYVEYQNVNPAIAAGNFLTNALNGNIYLSWYDTTALSLSAGAKLIDLKFTGSVGVCPLTWDNQTPGNCEYADSLGQTMPSSWTNGSVTVNQAPVITGNPSNILILNGNNATFSANATGANLSWRWQVSNDNGITWTNLNDGGNYANVYGSTLYVYGAPLSFTGSKYRCKVSGYCEPPAYTNAALLTVVPFIHSVIQSVTNCPGQFVVPITVNDFHNVGAFTLALNITGANLIYNGYQNPHSGLQGGNFATNQSGNTLFFSWFDTTATTLSNGTLLELIFTGTPGNSSVNWDLQTPGNCEYSDSSGTVLYSTWANGNITVHPTPAITMQPASITIANGGNTSFSSGTSGAGLSYQWQLSTDSGLSWFDLTGGGHYSNVNNPTLYVNNATLSMSGYQYRCRVSGTCTPAVFTNPASLTVFPLIITTCQSVTSCPGDIIVPVTATDFIGVGAFTMTFSFNPSILTYTGYQDLNQELVDGMFNVNATGGKVYISWFDTVAATLTSGATVVVLKFTGITGNSAMTWDLQTPGNCEYGDSNGAVIFSSWNNGTVNIHQPPVVVSHPISGSVNAGTGTSFSISATGTGLNYQWMVSSNNGSQWTNLTNVWPYSSVNGSTLQISQASASMNGYLYRCYVTGTCVPFQFSASAMLTVTQAAISTAIPNSYNSCTGNLEIPVNVTNCNNVGGITLALVFNQGVMTFSGYRNVNSALQPGMLVVNQNANTVYISWASATPATIGTGTLLTLLFRANPGISASFSWNTGTPGSCEYSDLNGNIIAAVYSGGSVSVVPVPLMVNAGQDVSIMPGDSVQLAGTASGGEQPYLYEWSPAIGLSNPQIPDPWAKPEVTTYYSITTSTANNCTGTDQVKVTVLTNIPHVTTDSVSNITFRSATSGGYVISDGGNPVVLRGVCWSMAEWPTINDNHTTDGAGLGHFISSMTNLTDSTMYYVRAYVINSNDTAYGQQRIFFTPPAPPNLAPTINAIENPNPINEDTGPHTILLAGISDGNADFSQNIAITTTSSNTELIPNPIVNYTPNDSTGSLTYYPALNAYGVSTITITVIDDGGTSNGGVNSVTISFVVTILPVNDPPIANAGSDLSAGSGANVVLNGTGSYDVDGDTLSFLWTAPEGINMNNPSSSHPTFNTPIVCTPAPLIFRLIVNDGILNSAVDSVIITVNPSFPNVVIRPLTLSDTLYSGSSSMLSLIVKNTGNCNLNFSLTNPYSWITFQPASGNIDAGDSLQVAVVLNSAGVISGTYNTAVQLYSNDPDEPQLIIPLRAVVYNVLTANAAATPDAICNGDSTMLHANVTGGSGVYSVVWTSEPSGFISSQENPVVNPVVPTTYFLSASDGISTVYDTTIVFVAENIAPSAINNMIPANNTFDLTQPVHFSWDTSSGATDYNLFIWPTNIPKPQLPSISGITQTYYVYSEPLNTNDFYYWQVVAENPCHETQSEINLFSFNVFSDLTVSEIVIPDSALAGTEIQLSFNVNNIGFGGTGNSTWKDDVYLCPNPTFNPATAFRISSYQNLLSLPDSSGYTRTTSLHLSNYLQGTYYLYVKTDDLNTVQESNEGNNLIRAALPLVIMMPPYPDLWVQDVHALSPAIVPDSAFTCGWIVQNIGNTSATGGWSQKVSIVSGAERRTLGYVQYSQPLASSGVIAQTATFNIPKIMGMEGFFHLEVELIPNPELIEKPDGELNNTAISVDSTELQKRLFLSIPQQTVTESNGSPQQCKIFRSGKQTNSLMVNLSASELNRLNFPTTVTIATNQSGAIFYLSTVNNNLLEGDKTVILHAEELANRSSFDTITIIDDETVSLTVQMANDTAQEGETVQVTVSRDLVTSAAVNVSLTSSILSQCQFSDNITIDPGQASASFNMLIVNDATPELTQEVILTASAAGFGSHSDTITVLDNDIPQVTIQITPDSVSESGGSFAAWGKISRLVSGNETIHLMISATPGNQVYFPSQVSIPGGIMEQQFNIGVVDNALLDGNRRVKISATIFLTSCNCGVPAETGGVVADSLTIIDNDGPSLSLTANPFVVPEGIVNAGVLTIARNTPVGEELFVTIQNNDTTEISVQQSATISATQTFVEIPYTSIDDSIEDGDQVTTLSVSSPGFAGGACWVMVSDRNLPDLVISDVALSFDTVYIDTPLPMELQITNNGFATAAYGIPVRTYLSANNLLDNNDVLISTTTTSSAIGIGETLTVLDTVIVSGLTGEFFLISSVNKYQEIHELLYVNNSSAALPLSVLPDYNATVSVEGAVFNGNTPIVINGTASTVTNLPAVNKVVDVYIVVGGVRREIRDTCDAQGLFTVNFQPLNGEAGEFYVGACFPGQGLNVAQDQFTVTGMKYTGNTIYWDMLLGQTMDSSILVTNFSSIDLHNVTMEIVSAPSGCSVVFNPIGNLQGNETMTMSYSLSANGLTSGTGFEPLHLRLNSAEGSHYDFYAHFRTKSPTGFITADPVTLVTTMVKGQSTIREITLKNVGLGNTGKITFTIPAVDWMSLVCQDTVSNLVPGATAVISVRLTPTDDLPLNTPITGNFAITCANANSLSIPFSIETISLETGDLSVDVVDEYTYYASSGAHVDSAHVVLRHPYTGAIIREGMTNSTGIFNTTGIPEGYYTITVTVPKHDSYQNNIFIEKGKVIEKTIFLAFQAITYSWNVVPTTTGDSYEVQLVVQYETNVPAPIVTVNMPDTMPHLNLGQQYPFLAVVTNIGLITAKDFTFSLPHDSEYVFQMMVDKFDILPQQSIQVPIVLKKRTSQLPAGPNRSSSYTVNCVDVVTAIYSYDCGWDNRMHEIKKLIQWEDRICYKIPNQVFYPIFPGNDTTNTNPGIPRDTVTTTHTIPVINISVDCVPCQNAIAKWLLDCVVCNLPSFNLVCKPYEVLDCATSVAFDCQGPNTSLDCVKSEMGCIPVFLDDPVGNVIDAYLCLDDLSKLCDDIPGTKPSWYTSATAKLQIPFRAIDKLIKIVYEIYGTTLTDSFNDSPWLHCSPVEYVYFYEYFNSINPLDGLSYTPELIAHKPSNITEETLLDFVNRWNSSVSKQNNLPYDTTNYIDLNNFSSYLDTLIVCNNEAVILGYTSVFNLLIDNLNELKAYSDASRNSICATISLNFSQSLTMTREAFEGTLTVFNGHEAIPMQNVALNLEIKDQNGVIKNDLFQINTQSLTNLTNIDGTGSLGSKQTGVAVVQFIPEQGAAPTLPKSYSFGGTLSYLDPFTNQMVTRPLYPVTLQVNPSPDLYLSFFMQRDIFGDDALTPLIEPMIPAELAVMINNKGAGTAVNVKLQSAQPEIIDNDKGLLINFQLIGSNLSGKPRNLGLYDVDFGNIAGGKIGIGQWFFTSTLLGHFVSYEATVNHLDSYGNQDLSLVSGIEIHELTHSVMAYGASNDTINDFLVNDIPDAHDFPDAIYFSTGMVADVEVADSAKTDAPVTINDTIVEMTIIPSSPGWNYALMDDPGNGKYRIQSVTRHVGQAIPLNNIWLTYCTLPDGGEPIYENKMHFADQFDNTTAVNYTIVFQPIDQNAPSVVKITGTPDNIASTPVDTLSIVFSEPIDSASFNYEDLTLRCQGGSNLIDSLVPVIKLNDTTYQVSLISKTPASGYYVFTVQTNGITDLVGNHGTAGKQVTWIQSIPIPHPTITGNDSVCAGNTGIIYKTEKGMVAYSWTISDGGIITSGAETDSIAVNWLVPGAHFISVTYANAAGNTPPGPTVKNIIVNPLPVPTVSGPLTACYNASGIVYHTESEMTGYNWEISVGGTIISGATDSVIAVHWIASGNQQLSVSYTDNRGCTSEYPTMVPVTVYPSFSAGNATTSQEICYNDSPMGLMASVPTGGRDPYTYQWQFSTDSIHFSDLSGATNLEFTPPALTTTTYYRQLQNSSGECGSLPTNVVTIIVYPEFQGGEIVENQTICYNTTPLELSGSEPGGGRTPYTYQWQISLDSLNYSTIQGATSLNYAPPALTAISYFRQVQTSAYDCGTFITNVVKVNVYPEYVVGSISDNQVICHNSVPETLSGQPPSGGHIPYIYQWQQSNDSVTFTNIAGATSLNYSPPSLTSTSWFRQIQTSSSECGAQVTNVVKITVRPEFQVGSINENQTICFNTFPATLTGNEPTGGHEPYSFQWQQSMNGTSFSNITGATSVNFSPPSLVTSTYYRQIQFSSSNCGALPTNVVKITVYPQFIAGSILGDQTICYNSIPLPFSGISPSGGNYPYTYQWQQSGNNVDFINIQGATSRNYSPPALTESTHYRQIQSSASGCGTVTTNNITINVYPQFVAGYISGDQTICYNTIPTELTGSIPTGGITPFTYQWQRSVDNLTFSNISGATVLNYSPPALTVTTRYRMVQYSASGCGALYSNIVSVTVMPPFVEGSISSDQVICYNTTPAPLTGSPPVGGVAPYIFQWQRSDDNINYLNIAGATSLNYSPPALLTTTYFRQVQTSAGGCGSLTSNVITITVYPQFNAGSISANQFICYNTSPATLTRIAPTGGSMPYSYQWQSSTNNVSYSTIAGATGATYQPGMLTNTSYFRQIQSSANGCGSLPSNVVTINVYPQFVAGSISSNQTICYNTAPSSLSGIAPSGGNTPYSYQWQRSSDNVNFANINGATQLNYSPPALLATTWYRLTQSSASGCKTLTTNVVTITVNPGFAAGSISSSQAICYNSTPSVLTGISPTGGKTPYIYQWQKSDDNVVFVNITGATSMNYSPSALTSSTFYRQIQSSSGNCGSLSTNVVTITVFPQFIIGTIAANQAISYNSVPAALTRTSPTGGSTPYTYQWQQSTDNFFFENLPGATSVFYQPPPLTATTYYRQLQASSNGCSSSNTFTNVVTITVYPEMVAGTIAADQIISQFTIPALLTGTVPTGGNPPYSYQWEMSTDNMVFYSIQGATGLNYQSGPLSVSTYFRQLQVSTGDFGVMSNVVTITVTSVPQNLSLSNINISGNQTQCYDATQTITIAGGESTFLVQSGGTAELIAGENILMLQGTQVEPGGNLHAYITMTGSYCGSLKFSIPSNTPEIVETENLPVLSSSDQRFACYPNPTTGRFTLCLSEEPAGSAVMVRIYNLLGVELFSKAIHSGKIHELTLENYSKGIYLVSVSLNGNTGVIKVIRQ